MTASEQPRPCGVDAGYTAGQYLDTPPGFAVYLSPRYLDKVTEEKDIADVSRRSQRRSTARYTVCLSLEAERFT